MNYYGVSSYALQNTISHYGTPGMKWGIRRFRNEDGSLTSEGRARYGVGDPRAPGVNGGIQASNSRNAAHNYRVQRFGSASAKALERKPQKLSKKELQARKTRAKRILAAAAAVGIGAAAIYGVRRYNKTTANLIQTAKNEIHKTYEIKTNIDQSKGMGKEYWRAHDMGQITSRRAAKKVLLLKGSKKTRQFIKANNLAKRKTSEIIEERTGPLVEGYHRSRLTGKFKKYSNRKARRIAEKLVRGGAYG